MGLEDLSLFRALPESTVLYPSDAVSAWYAVDLAASHQGLAYIRSGRPKQPTIYSNDEKFEIGKAKVVRQSSDDAVTVVGGGVTLTEALKAYEELKKQGVAIRVIDLFSVKPVDAVALLDAARACDNRILTVEDHYAQGGLGDAVMEAVAEAGVPVHRLAVREIPRSGPPKQLLERFGIGRGAIITKVRELVGG